MNEFKLALEHELIISQSNNYGRENFDEHRFGNIISEPRIDSTLFYNIKRILKQIVGYSALEKKRQFRKFIDQSFRQLNTYSDDLEYLYENLDSDGKELIVKIIAYRLLGYTKVKLPFNTIKYWNALDKAKTLRNGDEHYDPHFKHFILDKFDLSPIGYDIKLFFSEVGVAIDFIAEQYAYKKGDQTIVQADCGDTVLDIGGCWGDTALYFAEKVGERGKVYSFEFIPDNIKLFKINTDFNQFLKERIALVPNPVSDISNNSIYFKDNGPGSRIENETFEGQDGMAKTITIDDFVKNEKIAKVDFIKMDIEGAEPAALQGAIDTLQKFKPKLAIAIYHSMEDFVRIPRWILSLELGYEVFIGHYTIHSEETICFAKPKRR